MQNRTIRLLTSIGLSMLLLGIILGCNKQHTVDQTELGIHEQKTVEIPSSDPDESRIAEPITEKTPPIEEQVYKVSLSAIGDVLIHSSIYKDAMTEDGGYNFLPMFEEIRQYLEEADLAMANQESMIGGVEIGLSDYPNFNSPFEVGDALKEIGIDVVTMANNHTLDRGVKAVMNAIEHWRKIGMVYTGAYESEEDQQQIRIVERNGIAMSFLSYTYGTNGIPLPKDKPYIVNLIDHDQARRDIERARESSDLVIVNVHFGQEYVLMPNEEQKSFVQAAASAGADIIIGHHPHVLQPMEWIVGENGRRTFVIYSLGNFIAAQKGEYKQTGGIIQLEVEMRVKGEEKSIELKNPVFITTWISMENWRKYKIVPLKDVSENQLPNKQAHIDKIKEHMSQWMPELVIP